MDTAFYKDSYAYHLASHLLFECNHEDRTITFNREPLIIKRGQTVCGRMKLSQATGIAPSTIRNKLALLKNCRFLDIKSDSKFSIVTILNYDSYQNYKKHLGQQTGQPEDSQRTARGHTEYIKDTKNTSIDAPTLRVLGVFYDKYEKRVGKKYVASFGKDGKLMKEMLKVVPEDQIVILMDSFFESTDTFIIQAGYTLGVFRVKINSLQPPRPKRRELK